MKVLEYDPHKSVQRRGPVACSDSDINRNWANTMRELFEQLRSEGRLSNDGYKQGIELIAEYERRNNIQQ